jgi:hypothetical protein
LDICWVSAMAASGVARATGLPARSVMAMTAYRPFVLSCMSRPLRIFSPFETASCYKPPPREGSAVRPISRT